MPTPVASLLNRPEMTLNLGRSAARGSRLRLKVISAPAPLADQCGGEMPLPMNKTAKRLGAAVAAGDVWPPQNGTDSSHGKAIVAPTPLSNVRRLILVDGCVIASPLWLRHADDSVYHRVW